MNSSNSYQIYINQTLQLAETIVIKSSATAEALNQWVYASSGGRETVSPDPTTWKYYLNLSGEYHSIDTEMKVVSVDTLEEILFSKNNLDIHRATAREYRYGTRKYTELVSLFPDQEQLILGILYPADIDTAIAARDGEILAYPPNLIEENEVSFIPNLQQWIRAFTERWVVPGFYITDELYAATTLAILYQSLVPAILNLRLKACNTSEAHSFDIRQYLGSHGYLDEYMDQLSNKQALHFYRNIAYIERNVGKRDTFDSLVDHIMTERFIPIAEYTMKHDVSKQLDAHYPEVIFRKKQLNMGIVLDPDNQISIETMLDKEVELAPGNKEARALAVTQARSAMKNSASNVIATKALESEMVDESNSSPWILSEILLNHWIYLSAIDVYTAYISVENVKTGEAVPFTAKEAFILAMYAFAKSQGITLETIPKATASRVQRIPTDGDPFGATVRSIYSIVDPAVVPRNVALEALSKQPQIDYTISTEAFYEMGVKLYDAAQHQRFLIANQENFQRRGMVEAMVNRIYADHVVSLAPANTSYELWLSERNMDVSRFTRSDFELLYIDLVNQATGQILHPIQSMKALQDSMIRMFSQLSSYGIQVIGEINETSIRKTDWPGVRVGAVDAGFTGQHYSPYSQTVLDLRQATSQNISMDFNHQAVDPKFSIEMGYKVTSETNLKISPSKRPAIYNVKMLLPKIRVTSQDQLADMPRGRVPVVGMKTFLELSRDKQQSFKDIYNGGYYEVDINKLIPLKDVVIITELLPFDLSESKELLYRAITNVVLGKTYPQ